MKRVSLATRCMICIAVLLGVLIIETFALTMIYTDWRFPAEEYTYKILICGGCFVLVVIMYIVHVLISPYYKTKKLFRQFLEGKAYQELFEMDVFLTPEFGQVLMQFHHLLDKQDAIKISKRQAEYLALQNQINPHFLYNTLEAIRGDALGEGMNSIAETTEALSTFFRYTITGVEHLVSLEDELENVENYYLIQQYRFGEKIQLTVHYPIEEEAVQALKMPKLILQPLVENAIFHGLESKLDGGYIHIRIEVTIKNLLISVEDNGIGMDVEMVNTINDYLERVAVSYVNDDKKKRGGIAMKNVNSRIKLLFGEDYGIHVYSTQGVGTQVKITLPLMRK